tara:strand:+ start:518 stop:643 length:126 start_codon:yes stop_codon:yes gene_type:complete
LSIFSGLIAVMLLIAFTAPSTAVKDDDVVVDTETTTTTTDE